MELSEVDKRFLLKIARSAIKSTLEGKVPEKPKVDSKALSERSGVFVTLKINGDLRGCIGYIEPVFPLVEATQEVAIKAAFEDPRFPPLTFSEFDAVEIEISVLSPLEELDDFEKIEIGKHGLVIDAGFRRGLLLPQVAVEYGWDREEFLRHTALKAGLPPESWRRKDVKLYTFTVQKFSEADFGNT